MFYSQRRAYLDDLPEFSAEFASTAKVRLNWIVAMASALFRCRADHRGDSAAGTLAYPDFLGGVLLSFRFPGYFHCVVWAWWGRSFIVCGGGLARSAVSE